MCSFCLFPRFTYVARCNTKSVLVVNSSIGTKEMHYFKMFLSLHSKKYLNKCAYFYVFHACINYQQHRGIIKTTISNSIGFPGQLTKLTLKVNNFFIVKARMMQFLIFSISNQ